MRALGRLSIRNCFSLSRGVLNELLPVARVARGVRSCRVATKSAFFMAWFGSAAPSCECEEADYMERRKNEKEVRVRRAVAELASVSAKNEESN